MLVAGPPTRRCTISKAAAPGSARPNRIGAARHVRHLQAAHLVKHRGNISTSVAALKPVAARQVLCHYYDQHSSSTTIANEYEDYDDDDDYDEDEDYNDDEDDDEDDGYSSNDDEDDMEDRIEVHHVHKRLPLQCVALGDHGKYVVSYEDGDMAWSGLSDGLYDELKKTQRYKRAIDTVAMGRNQGSVYYRIPSDPEEVWFLRRTTGTTYMGTGCEVALRQTWDEGTGDEFVVKVAFAPDCGYIALLHGGSASWLGLPSSLDQQLQVEYWSRDGLETVSVGHNGEWFVSYNDGHYVWCGVHPTLEWLLEKKKDMTGNVAWVELGPDGTFVALFEKYTCWYGGRGLTDCLLACM